MNRSATHEQPASQQARSYGQLDANLWRLSTRSHRCPKIRHGELENYNYAEGPAVLKVVRTNEDGTQSV